MTSNITTTASYITLAVVSIEAWSSCLDLQIFSYMLITLNSFLGIAFLASGEEVDSQLELIFFLTQTLQMIFVVPLIVFSTYFRYGYPIVHSLMHILILAWPLLQQIIRGKIEDIVIDFVLTVNLVSFAGVCFFNDNVLGIAAVAIYGANHNIYRKEMDIFPLPIEDVYNYGLCLFVYFTRKGTMDINYKI